jgi:hypothetical protein
MQINDRRTPENLETHCVLVVARDIYLSSWGPPGSSICAWACKPEDADKVFEWVDGRNEMKNVRFKKEDYKPRNAGHFSIYVVHDTHRSLKNAKARS